MCSEVMYGAYYPYLYATSRAGPATRPFYTQYDRVGVDIKHEKKRAKWNKIKKKFSRLKMNFNG